MNRYFSCLLLSDAELLLELNPKSRSGGSASGGVKLERSDAMRSGVRVQFHLLCSFLKSISWIV